MHLAEKVYITHYNILVEYSAMHDLRTSYKKCMKLLRMSCQKLFEYDGKTNTRKYTNKPILSDIEVVCLAITAEALQIDSENLLWSKLKTDYPDLFQVLPHRTRYNARKKYLRNIIAEISNIVSDLICDNTEQTDLLVIDSMPIEICKIVRENNSLQFRRSTDEVKAAKGFNSAHKQYYLGYKLHLITNEAGIYRDMLITPANVHDIEFLKELKKEDIHLMGKTLLGDRAYLSHTHQLRLFEDLDLNVNVPYRRNQKDFKKYSHHYKIKRKTIETTFAQYIDEYLIRRNYSKSFAGFDVRINCKIAAKTLKQLWNVIHEKPVNHTKHAFAA